MLDVFRRLDVQVDRDLFILLVYQFFYQFKVLLYQALVN